MADPWNTTYEQRPTSELCEREIEIHIVGTRCIYLNGRRIAGGKPYVSENLPSRTMKLKVRDALGAFSEAEILAYLNERRERNAYCAGARNYRDFLAARNPDNE